MLRVLTLNLWHRAGPWRERLAIIRAGLQRFEPHLVGVQETLRFGSSGPWTCENDQAAELVADGDYTVVFAPGGDLGGGLCLGNALLSRYAVRETASFSLPTDGSDLQRSLLFALVDTPRAPTPVFVTHLSWRLEASALRARQVSAILERVAQHARPDCLPAVLMGDFNAAPETREIRLLTVGTPDGPATPFLDAWNKCPGPGYTFDPRNHFAAEAKEQPRRIDYIFLERRADFPEADFKGTQLVFDEPCVGADGHAVWASDHFGLVTDIAL